MQKILCNRFFLMGIVLMVLIVSINIVGASNVKNETKACPSGDMNNDCLVGLEEAIIALQVMAGFTNDIVQRNAALQRNEKTDEKNPAAQSLEDYIDLSSIVPMIESIDFSEQNFAPIVKSMINSIVLPCGQLTIKNIYPVDAYFQFNGAQECLGVTGSIQFQSNIFDTKAYLTFDQFSYEGVTVSGNATASIKPQDCGYMATLSSDSFSVAGHQLSGVLFATHSEKSKNALLVGLKGSDTFNFGDNQIQLEGDLSYSHKGGVNGTAKTIINNKVILITFENLVIDLAKLVPQSGMMTINNTPIHFSIETSHAASQYE